MNRYMARDYVTIRNEGTEEEPIWTESLVGKALLKSARQPGLPIETAPSTPYKSATRDDVMRERPRAPCAPGLTRA